MPARSCAWAQTLVSDGGNDTPWRGDDDGKSTRSTSTATSSVPSPPTLALWFHSQLLVACVCTMAVPSSHVQYCGSLSRTRAHYSFLLDCRLMMTAQYTPIESGMLRSYLDFMVEGMGSEIVFALGVGHSEHAACGLHSRRRGVRLRIWWRSAPHVATERLEAEALAAKKAVTCQRLRPRDETNLDQA